MLWVILAIIGAIANAAYYIIIKKYVKMLDLCILSAFGFIGGAFILFGLSAAQGFPVIGPGYWTAVLVSAALNVISLLLIYSALSSSDLSLSMPMLSFTPAFLIGTSFIVLGELPSVIGIMGILIIVGGSYVLNISSEHENLLDPVRSMFRNRASWYMLIVALLFALSINYDKVGMENSNPVFGMSFTLLFIGIPLAGIGAISKSRAKNLPHLVFDNLRPYCTPAILIAVFAAIEAVSINFAYTLQIVPYIIAIKRLAILIMVLYGIIVFKEREFRMRIAGATMMVCGAVLIILFA